MCGIVGHLAFHPDHRISESLLTSLNQLLTHRGPDAEGQYLNGNIALAMKRLSIIDLQGGIQPVISNNNRYILIFNGEIYNHNELRKDLIAKGYPLRTRCDSEVVLYSFIDKGAKCLNDFNGMFSFSIWDNLENELFLARDRLGVKPLYYTLDSKRLMFASEITPIIQSNLFTLKFNFEAISDYLAYWYFCEPNSIFENIHQVPPGSYARIRGGKIILTSYWNIPTEKEISIPYQEAVNQLHELLQDSIKLRLNVDVPVGTFLSGGVDSGLITAIAARHSNSNLESFFVGFKEKSYSEIENATLTAKQNSVSLNAFEIRNLTPDILEKAFLAFDEPLGNTSLIPTYLLSKFTREKVTVVLTGDGADELFGGYPTYQAPYYQTLNRCAPKFLTDPLKKLASKIPVSHKRISLDFRLKQLARGISLPYQRAHYSWREVTPLSLQKSMFHDAIWKNINRHDPFSVVNKYFKKAQNLSLKNQLMYVDMNTYLLNDHLRKVDRMSMAHGLEARLPYLDYRIVEFAARLPSEHKVTFLQTKRILKTIAQAYLPQAVISGKKMGLTAPIASWTCTNMREYIHDNLKGGLLSEWFVSKEIQQLLEDHFKMKKDNSRILWGLLSLQIWSKKLKPNP